MTWTAADDFRFCIRMGLTKGLQSIRGMRRALTEEERTRIAGAIADHLRLCGYKIEAGHASFVDLSGLQPRPGSPLDPVEE